MGSFFALPGAAFQHSRRCWRNSAGHLVQSFPAVPALQRSGHCRYLPAGCWQNQREGAFRFGSMAAAPPKHWNEDQVQKAVMALQKFIGARETNDLLSDDDELLYLVRFSCANDQECA